VYFLEQKKERITGDQQQQHIQAVKLYDDWPLKGVIDFLGVVFAKFSIFFKFIFPGIFTGPGIGTFFKTEGLPAGD